MTLLAKRSMIKEDKSNIITLGAIAKEEKKKERKKKRKKGKGKKGK